MQPNATKLKMSASALAVAVLVLIGLGVGVFYLIQTETNNTEPVANRAGMVAPAPNTGIKIVLFNGQDTGKATFQPRVWNREL